MSPRPREVTDRYGQVWTLMPDYDCYRHDHPDGTILSPLGELQLDNAAPGNVFEWCWENVNLGDPDRATLLHVAFGAVGEPHPTVGPLMMRNTDPHSVGRLIEAGWLGYDSDDQGISFPAYQKWLTEHEVAT